MNKIIGLISMILLAVTAQAQYWEIGVFAGASQYNGELTDSYITPEETHFAYGGVIRYNLNPFWSIRGSIIQGYVSGKDANNTALNKIRRNLSFESPVLEFSITPEWNITGYKVGSRLQKVSPYVFAGVGIFRFNPMAEYNGDLIPLQPLGTEGQESVTYNDRKKYALTQICIPFGVGAKFSVSKRVSLNLEVRAAKLFTDYLDDVSKTYAGKEVLQRTSQNFTGEGSLAFILADRSIDENGQPAEQVAGTARGNETTMDWYYFAGVSLTYTIFPPRCFKF